MGSRVRVITHPDPAQLELTDVLHALSDPVRLRIVVSLSELEESPCGRFEVGVTKSTLSHHLKVLRDAGLTRTRNVGVQRIVCLRREDLDSRFPGLLDCVLTQARRDERVSA